ncbi:MAG: hypothetical protein H7258_14740 [Ferruginibacter sp.]|nr:hypothetical protein [Ferruginibacter sp.]
MIKNEKLKFIEGTFLYEEAKEVLFNIFSAKINFHQMKNFSSQERFGKDDEIATRRIPALKNEIVKLEKILADARTKKKKLIISSEINISLSDD